VTFSPPCADTGRWGRPRPQAACVPPLRRGLSRRLRGRNGRRRRGRLFDGQRRRVRNRRWPPAHATASSLPVIDAAVSPCGPLASMSYDPVAARALQPCPDLAPPVESISEHLSDPVRSVQNGEAKAPLGQLAIRSRGHTTYLPDGSLGFHPRRRRGGPADGTRHGPGSPFSAAQVSTASRSRSWTFTPRSTA